VADQTTADAGPGNPLSEPSDAARPRPTLKDIAFMTGLGVATVSRALNDAPDIGQATKERVRLVARQIGYRPNRAGVRLRTGKTNVISIVLHHEAQIADSMPQLMFGIAEALVATPYHLIMTPYFTDGDPMDPVTYVVESGSADGIIISRMQPDDPRVRYLTEQNFPFATHGRTDMGIEHAYHDFDNAAFARAAISWLVGRGRKRIALLGPPNDLTYQRHTENGFLAAIAEHDLIEIPIHVNTDSHNEAIVTEARRLMTSRHPPDGIVCSSSAAALAACMGVEEAGHAVGDGIDFVVKQYSDLKLRPAIHVIRENHRKAGQTLANAVIKLIEGAKPASLQTIEVPPAT